MPLLTGPFTTIARDNFTGTSGDLDAHTPDCSPLPDCGFVGWEYGTSTDWQLESNGAVAQNQAAVFCRNTFDIIPSAGPFRIYCQNFRAGVAQPDWLGGFHFFVDKVGVKGSLAANRSGVSFDVREDNPEVRLTRFNDSGAQQEQINVQENFAHLVSTARFYGCDVAGDGRTVTCWHAPNEAAIASPGPTVFGDFVLAVNVRDSNHRRVGLAAGSGGTSGRNFESPIVLQLSDVTQWDPPPARPATVWTPSL